MGEDWALRMADAFGKPGADLMDLRFIWIGSYDECVQIRSTDRTSDSETGDRYDINGQYCWLHFPFNKSMTPDSAKYIVTRENVPTEFRIGTCFPEKCSEDDIKIVVRAVSGQLRRFNTPSKMDVRCKTSKGLSAGAIVCLVILFVLGLLLAIGTAYDVIVMRLKLLSNGVLTGTNANDRQAEMVHLNGNENQSSTVLEVDVNETKGGLNGSRAKNDKIDEIAAFTKVGSDNIRTKSNEPGGIVYKFCMAFSIIKNGEEILEVKESKTRINAVEGIRVLTLSWIIMLHLRGYNEDWSANSDLNVIDKLSTDWTLLGIANGYSVDTFFAISGFLLAYVLLRKLKQCGGFRKFNWGFFYLFRFWRLSPAFYIVFLVYWKLIFGGYFTGPLWFNVGDPGVYVSNCDRVWWKLLLYIHNFADEKSCFTPTWFVASDMQMYILSPLILVPLFCFSKIGLAIAGVCIAGSVIYTVTVSWIYEFLPSYSFVGITGNEEAYFNLVNFYPFSHISSFVIGITTGFILYKRRETMVLSRMKNLAGWAAAICTCAALPYLPFRGYDKQDLATPEYLGALSEYHFYYAIFEGLVRSLWSCSVCWMMIACAVGHGGFINTLLGWKPFVVLGRLSYSTYLMHEIVILVYVQSRQTLKFHSDISWAFDTVAVVTMSFGAGFLLSVSLETPFFALRKLLFKGNM